MRTAISLLTLSLTASLASAQAAWTSLAPATTPGALSDVVGTTDLLNMYVFGGRTAGGARSDALWRFDPVASDWANMSPAGTLPTGRQACAAAFDYSRGKLVVFGGRTANGNTGIVGDTWEWDLATNTWTEMTPAVPVIGVNTPPELESAQMVYESLNGRCLLFGGRGNLTTAPMETGETWAWDGTNWTNLNPTNSPPVRRNHAMGYDLDSGIAMVWGGIAAGTVLGDTWTWDGSDWTQVVTATTPFDNGTHSGALLCRLVHDGVRDRFVLTSGTYPGGTATTLSETWEFDGTDWNNRGTGAIGRRYSAAVAHILATGKTYSFGGYNGGQIDQTWEYQTNAVATFNAGGTAGLACPSSGGFGTPALSAESLPWIGEQFVIGVSNINPAAAIQAVMINPGAPIAPVNLAVLGSPSCNILAGPASSLPIVGGQASIMIPFDVAIIGLAVSTQALTIEVPWHIAGSERADAVIGAL